MMNTIDNPFDRNSFADLDDEQVDAAIKKTAINVLEEFNRWRRGEGEYAWNEDPQKYKQLSIEPAVIGEAIDYAVNYLKNH